MAFKMSKGEETRRNDLVTALREAKEELETAVKNYNELVRDAETLRDEVHTRLKEEFDEKSEKWQEGDGGVEAGETIDAWENQSFEEIDEQDLVHADELEALP